MIKWFWFGVVSVTVFIGCSDCSEKWCSWWTGDVLCRRRRRRSVSRWVRRCCWGVSPAPSVHCPTRCPRSRQCRWNRSSRSACTFRSTHTAQESATANENCTTAVTRCLHDAIVAAICRATDRLDRSHRVNTSLLSVFSYYTESVSYGRPM